MAIVFAIVLGLLALAFVLYPLVRPASSVQETPATMETTNSRESGEFAEREQAAKSAIQEVELDYQLGNIADTDYHELRDRYTRRALTALKSRYAREQEIDEEIEEQLQKMKETQESQQS
jgi:uncharacterized membrane protein